MNDMPEKSKRGRPKLGDKAVTKAITVYLTEEDAEAVKSAAASHGVAPAVFVRKAVEKILLEVGTI